MSSPRPLLSPCLSTKGGTSNGIQILNKLILQQIIVTKSWREPQVRAMESEWKQKDFRKGGAIKKIHIKIIYYRNMKHNGNDHLPLNRYHGGQKTVK